MQHNERTGMVIVVEDFDLSDARDASEIGDIGALYGWGLPPWETAPAETVAKVAALDVAVAS